MEEFNQRMDNTKPQWSMISICNKSPDARRHLYIFRISHGMGDGVRISKIVGDCCTFKDGKPAENEVFTKMKTNKLKMPNLLNLVIA